MSKVKTKTISKDLGNADIMEEFNKMLGVSNAESKILIPKLKLIESKVKAIHNNINVFISRVAPLFPKQEEAFALLKKTNASIVLKPIDYKSIAAEPKDIMEAQINTVYKDTIRSDAVERVVEMYKRLHDYEKMYTMSTKETVVYMKRLPGSMFNPFPFSDLNIKDMWVSGDTNIAAVKFVNMVLKLQHKSAIEVVTTIKAPNVDIKKMSKLLIGMLTSCRSQIPRCDMAFDKIQNAIGMMEDNFSGYYEEFAFTKNPAIMMERFISDVSGDTKSGKKNAVLIRQFKVITLYIQKNFAAKQKTSTKFDGMLNMLDKVMA